MKEIFQRRSELLVSNRKTIHKEFFLEDSLLITISAATFAEIDKSVDAENLKDCKKLLREKQGIFSELRGNNELTVATKMALSGDPEGYLDNVTTVYKLLQKGKFFDSAYRVIAAITICDAGKISEAESIVEKTNAILKGMKKQHPFLTNDEDTTFAVLLALTDRSVEDILAELEETFPYIKKSFSLHDNAVYSLCQVLATYDGNIEEKRDKVLDIYEIFKAKGAKYGADYELASLGTLINIDTDKDELVSEIIEVAEYLKGNKGFGMLDMSKQKRLMFGTMIVAGAYAADNYKTNASVVGGAVASVIAMQTAMLVAIMMAASASSAAAASSN